MTRSRLLVGVLAVGLVGAGALAARSLRVDGERDHRERARGPDRARVPRTLELIVHMNGDLRATRQVSLTAPSVGGALRVLKVLETGTTVNEGDVIMSSTPPISCAPWSRPSPRCSRPIRKSQAARRCRDAGGTGQTDTADGSLRPPSRRSSAPPSMPISSRPMN